MNKKIERVKTERLWFIVATRLGLFLTFPTVDVPECNLLRVPDLFFLFRCGMCGCETEATNR